MAIYGIQGKGTKTVICGLTDNFPLISPLNNINLSRFSLANLTSRWKYRNLLLPRLW
jgi:hypothetical protein